jgi:CxxC motif-containing protein (DUF1111 family)
MPPRVRLGGDTTVFVGDADAFTHPAPNLSREGERTFFKGRALFRDQWVIAPASTDSRDGLGPFFNARSCEACHVRDGRGRPPEDGEPMTQMFVRLSIPGAGEHGAALEEPTYGEQIQPFGTFGAGGEAEVYIDWEIVEGSYADGEPFELRRPRYRFESLAYGPLRTDVKITGRIPRRLVGLGLLASIPEADIRGGDGLPNEGWDVERSASQLGRFGWKATQPSVRQQSALAFLHDLGISTSLYPVQPCSAVQEDCALAPSGGEPELYDAFLDNVAFYTSALAVPARRDWDEPEVLQGEELFEEIGCAHCHQPEQRTGEDVLDPAFANQRIFPYTDLLLHDMGEDLSDGREDYAAEGRHWRTPPLWGIGLLEEVNGHLFLLHDGRARGFAEAILWHGGEAQSAREAFRRLSSTDRAALVRFLESL